MCSQCKRKFLQEVWGANYCKCCGEWRCNQCYSYAEHKNGEKKRI